MGESERTLGRPWQRQSDEAATIGMKNGTRLREARVTQALQQVAKAEENTRREAQIVMPSIRASHASVGEVRPFTRPVWRASTCRQSGRIEAGRRAYGTN